MSRITVLLPARNASKTIAETLESLVQQTHADFEVLLVNDASVDETESIAKSFSSRLNLRIVSLVDNAGVAGALNAGLRVIDSEYIARIDADDIAFPTRLALQLSFMDNNPGIDVCGTAIEIFSNESNMNTIVTSRPIGDAAIKTCLIQAPSLVHPSTMIRRSYFEDVGYYDARFDFAEDYDLWCRGALLGKCFANLKEVLLRYRSHSSQVSVQKIELQLERDLQIKRKYISALLGGESSGNLAEFFSTKIGFKQREVALMVFVQSIPKLFKLGARMPDDDLYQKIIAGCVERHLV